MKTKKFNTYKEKLRHKWFWSNLILGLSLFFSLPIAIITKDERWFFFCILIIIIVPIAFPTKCPSCNASIYIRPGTKALLYLNYCQKCGFQLNNPIKADNEPQDCKNEELNKNTARDTSHL